MATDEYKVVIMGPGGTGKSAITLQLMQQRFVEGHDPTIEDSYQKYLNVEGKPCRLDILDTAGQEEFKSMRSQYMRQGQGFILVYSITDKVSFEKCKEFYEEVQRAKGGKDNVVIVLVGNKSDLKDDRQVPHEEGQKCAKDEFQTPLFFETSAKENTNIEQVFETLITRIRTHGVEPCSCKGAPQKCKCKDRCATCGATRNNHKRKDDEHPFKEQRGASWLNCTIL
jgi:GTPase KRas protein